MASAVLILASCNESSSSSLQTYPTPSASSSSSASASASASAPASASASASASTSASEPSPSPVIAVRASLEELKPDGRPIPVEGCQELFIAPTKGKAKLGEETLAENDVAVIFRPGSLRLSGDGSAIVVHVLLVRSECDGDAGAAPSTKFVHGQKTQPIRWAKGAMSAWLDVGPEVTQHAYFGRLAGTAPVAEHVHKDSWELIYAADASGTFVLDGKEQKLGPKQIVAIPPNTKHEWKPDAGSTLRALQVYAPRGPEQRFKGLAAAEAQPAAGDAGAK